MAVKMRTPRQVVTPSTVCVRSSGSSEDIHDAGPYSVAFPRPNSSTFFQRCNRLQTMDRTPESQQTLDYPRGQAFSKVSLRDVQRADAVYNNGMHAVKRLHQQVDVRPLSRARSSLGRSSNGDGTSQDVSRRSPTTSPTVMSFKLYTLPTTDSSLNISQLRLKNRQRFSTCLPLDCDPWTAKKLAEQRPQSSNGQEGQGHVAPRLKMTTYKGRSCCSKDQKSMSISAHYPNELPSYDMSWLLDTDFPHTNPPSTPPQSHAKTSSQPDGNISDPTSAAAASHPSESVDIITPSRNESLCALYQLDHGHSPHSEIEVSSCRDNPFKARGGVCTSAPGLVSSVTSTHPGGKVEDLSKNNNAGVIDLAEGSVRNTAEKDGTSSQAKPTDRLTASDIVNAEKMFGPLAQCITAELPTYRIMTLYNEGKKRQLLTEDKKKPLLTDGKLTEKGAESLGRAGLVYNTDNSAPQSASSSSDKSRQEFAQSYIQELSHLTLLNYSKKMALQQLWPQILSELVSNAVRDLCMDDVRAQAKKCLQELEKSL